MEGTYLTTLVVCDRHDVHADLVISKIEALGRRTFRLDVDEDSLKETTISFHSNGFTIFRDGRYVESSKIESHYFRRSHVELPLEKNNLADVGQKIWRGEWNKALHGIIYFLRDVRALIRPRQAFYAENKFMQMDVARRAGFLVPESLISNSVSELTMFCQNFADVALKMMHQDMYLCEDGVVRGLYVNKIGGRISEFEASGENPIFLQQYIDKAYEVRYTAVGRKHFVCKIDSQKSAQTSEDWRRYDLPNTPHSSIEPPGEIRNRVSSYMETLGLCYGALDFIVTPTGEWYFLEINPMGQWLWIEDLTGMPVSDALASWLVDGETE